MGIGCSWVFRGQMLGFSHGVVGFWKVSETEGHVKWSLGSGQLLLGQQELLLSDATALASSPATARFTFMHHLAWWPKTLNNVWSVGTNSAQVLGIS